MRIIEAKGTPNGRRVRVFLAEKGITVEGVNIDLRAGDNLGAEHRAKNPFGRIPLIEHQRLGRFSGNDFERFHSQGSSATMCPAEAIASWRSAAATPARRAWPSSRRR